MRLFLGFLCISVFSLSIFAQNSSNYLKVQDITVSSTDSKKKNLLNADEIGGDKQPARGNYRDSKTTKQIPPTESQLEDRQDNFTNFQTNYSVSNNQYIGVLLENLSGKEIKKISLKFILKQNGQQIYERKFSKQPRFARNGKFYVSESYFAEKNLANLSKNAEKEIIIESISFTDGTKVKF
ncbi:MAG: hypothetical protein MUC29_07630 [Pyrinomonadaceae bacterium]|jgi:hypothetical protein|nr:hypothetical protein [Pyrinomonadaceae bacterium]